MMLVGDFRLNAAVVSEWGSVNAAPMHVPTRSRSFQKQRAEQLRQAQSSGATDQGWFHLDSLYQLWGRWSSRSRSPG